MLTFLYKPNYIRSEKAAILRQDGKIMQSQTHAWISDVLADLEAYCEQNNLSSTMRRVEEAKRALWLEIQERILPKRES